MLGEDATSISNENETYFFGVKEIHSENHSVEFAEKSDIYLNEKDDQITLKNLSANNIAITVIKADKKYSKVLKPGEAWNLSLN